jgi:adenylate cyclase
MSSEFKGGPHSIIDKFLALLAISHRMIAEKDFDELLNIITIDAAKLLEAERAAIFLLDRTTGQLWAKTALGVSESIRFDSRLGIAGAVLVSGKNIIVEDAYNSPLFYPSVDSKTGFQTRNILTVPLRNIRREIIGVFQVLNKAEG